MNSPLSASGTLEVENAQHRQNSRLIILMEPNDYTLIFYIHSLKKKLAIFLGIVESKQ